ncbi:endonuclease/exonuclease/phosphatase family protein [Chryseobacterium sp. PTM-20240506]|uniref:endonuclease/exonuclease/phosphatase family protein n=1 Tax=unclassified Chryseobacterium TaxID=2593645 RepID=UPI002358D934|nr:MULTISPECIES: endonuclease/exonuclease/phosphatase family protein [unclassified Chryseobacterium]MDC8103059.1 endonuclease/exonuclease/phosphatase family protein [Chryseobacterium sp. B21-037]MDQ1802608.1 endonuclease/exonuclease/phosphatase family protein [Chryseobacterium sp. CKR4-1]
MNSCKKGLFLAIYFYNMWSAYLILTGLLVLLTLLPKIQNQHWIFRVPEFGKIQITYFIVLTFLLGFFFRSAEYFWYFQGTLFILFVHHGVILVKYTPLYRVRKHQRGKRSSQKLHFISANVYQFNTEYDKFIGLINRNKPEMFLTMESNGVWENALRALEKDYPYHHKVTLENTYGMHFYSKIQIKNSTTHYFVAEDIPSIEIHLETEDGFSFVFFGVHPPPPSPTEEATSKERDGDLLSIAKRVKDITEPVLVVGDFNNVAWSRSSILFRKTSHLIDPRIGRAFVPTFHARYQLLRFPIDLMFHSEDIFIKELKTLDNFGSDHLPVYCEFFIDHHNTGQEERIEVADAEEKAEAEEMIIEGKKEDGDRDAVVTE